jgi:hypothetical protein
MAAPTPTTTGKRSGNYGWTSWTATWDDSTNLSDSAVVDLSAQDPFTRKLKLLRGSIVASTGISALLEYDDDSADELIAQHPVGASGKLDFDYTGTIDGGITYRGSGGTGDIVLTTTSAASGDEVTVYLEWVAYLPNDTQRT